MTTIATRPANTQTRITRQRRVDFAFEIRELIRRKGLIKYLTMSTLKAGHRDLVLGELWWLLEPVLHMLIFVFLVTVIFKRQMPNYPVFVFCAILPFRWLTQAVTQSQQVVCSLGGLMRDVAFPKAVYPISLVTSNFVNFMFGFLFLIVLTLAYGIMPTLYWLWLIPLIVQFYVMTLGLSLLLTGLTVLFQDLKNIVVFAFQLLFYLSPSLYAVEHVPEQFRPLYMLNPLSVIFTSWREVLINQHSPDLVPFAVVSVFSVLLLALGFVSFVRLEKVFPKIL